MEYLTASEIAAKWNVSEQLVRRHCRENRIPDAYQEFGTWYIPADAEKPARKQKEVKPTPILLKKILKQRDGKQYRGFYEYLQINMVYSSGRMASNRLTRNQIEVLYKPTGKEIGKLTIVSDKDKKLKLKTESGEIVDAKDVNFRSKDEAMVYSAVLGMGVNPVVAQSIVDNFDGTDGMVYAADVKLAYQYGKILRCGTCLSTTSGFPSSAASLAACWAS